MNPLQSLQQLKALTCILKHSKTQSLFKNGQAMDNPSFAASLEPLVHRQHVANLSLLYRYYFGRSSSELAEMIPLPYSSGRSIHYSDTGFDLSFGSVIMKICPFTISYWVNEDESMYSNN